jgi:hypothetical protein
MAVIFTANPKMQGILFDREDVSVGGHPVLELTRVVDRCQIVGGSFFDFLPRLALFTYSLASFLIRNEVILFRLVKIL